MRGGRFRVTRHVGVPPLLTQVIACAGGTVGRGCATTSSAVAAVIGQDVPLATWATVSGVDAESLAAVVERATDAHLLRETADGAHARFAHALIREALVEEILPSRRRRLHQRVAEASELLPTPDFDALAYHYRQAGDARAERWFVVAGMPAYYAGALLSASERLRPPWRSMEEQGGHAAERAWLLLYLATVHRWRDPHRSLREMDEAVRLAAEVGDRALTAWMLRNHGLHLCRVGALRAGIAEMLRGEEMVAGDPHRGARLVARLRLRPHRGGRNRLPRLHGADGRGADRDAGAGGTVTGASARRSGPSPVRRRMRPSGRSGGYAGSHSPIRWAVSREPMPRSDVSRRRARRIKRRARTIPNWAIT